MTKIPDRLDVFFLLKSKKITINQPKVGTNEEEFKDLNFNENSHFPFYPSMFEVILAEIVTDS